MAPVTATAYRATATREGSWWVLDVDGVGVTQCARLTDARAQIRGLIEAVEDRDVPEDTHIDVHLDGPVDAAIEEAREAASVAETLRDFAAAKMRLIARQLVSERGLKQAEAAIILDVSKQRITQLLTEAVKAQPAFRLPLDGSGLHIFNDANSRSLCQAFDGSIHVAQVGELMVTYGISDAAAVQEDAEISR